MCVIWGTTYLAIRIALEAIPPFLMGAVRWVASGGLLIAILKLRGERLPTRREWPSLAVLGVLLIAVGNGRLLPGRAVAPERADRRTVSSAPFWTWGRAVDVERGLVIGFSGIVPGTMVLREPFSARIAVACGVVLADSAIVKSAEKRCDWLRIRSEPNGLEPATVACRDGDR